MLVREIHFPLHIYQENIPQGLKPSRLVGFIGTTEVVPFQNPDTSKFIRSLWNHLLSKPRLCGVAN
jgi:hypothetical protein